MVDQPRCGFCGSFLHPTVLCQDTWDGIKNKKNLACTYCGSQRHEAPYCLLLPTGQTQRNLHPEGKWLL